MLDGIWQVQAVSGENLGRFSTTVGNDALLLNETVIRKIRVEDILHMFERDTTKRWAVRVTAIRDETSVFIEKIGDLP